MRKGELLATAIKVALEAHDGQFDRGGNPYILHPLTVMHKLRTTDEELQAIAVLHDAVEDNKKITYQYLRELGMTERVIDGVRAITKVPGETEDEYKQKVFENIDTMKVKREDLRTNMDPRRLKGIAEKDIARNVKYTIFYYEIEQRLRDLAAPGARPNMPHESK